MGKVDAIAFPGWEAWFNSNDHTPPHFHLEKPGDWQVRVMFMETPVRLEYVYRARRRGMTASERLRVSRAVDGSRAALLAEWERKARAGGDE